MGGVHDGASLGRFVFSGAAGPTGRPLAMLSFLIDNNTWNESSGSYKYTNLMLHLLNGSLLAWAGLLLGRCLGWEERTSQRLAVFNAAMWMLHPLFVSTTLYIIQRMTLLAALCCLGGVTAYLHGRLLLATRPLRAYLWMTAGLGLGTLLGTLCKENAALLPLLILVIEYCLPERSAQPPWPFRAIFLWLPSLAILIYLISMLDFSPNIWPTRPFNQVQRLLTEPRILWMYINQLLLPKISAGGLYHDDIPISTTLTNPPSTLWAILSLLCLIATALAARYRFPLFSLAVLFYLAGHLIESSVIGLELYFEHRNYLPAAFFFMPLGLALFRLQGRLSTKTLPLVVSAPALMLGFLTHQRAELWGQPDLMTILWAQEAPYSARAQRDYAALLFNHGQQDKAFQVMNAAIHRLPNNASLLAIRLRAKMALGPVTQDDFVRYEKKIALLDCDLESLPQIKALSLDLIGKKHSAQERQAALRFLDELDNGPYCQGYPDAKLLFRYLKGRLALAQDRPNEALNQYTRALEKHPPANLTLLMVAELATRHYPEHAMKLLDRAEARRIFKNHRQIWPPFRPDYEEKARQIREALQKQTKKRPPNSQIRRQPPHNAK